MDTTEAIVELDRVGDASVEDRRDRGDAPRGGGATEEDRAVSLAGQEGLRVGGGISCARRS